MCVSSSGAATSPSATPRWATRSLSPAEHTPSDVTGRGGGCCRYRGPEHTGFARGDLVPRPKKHDRYGNQSVRLKDGRGNLGDAHGTVVVDIGGEVSAVSHLTNGLVTGPAGVVDVGSVGEAPEGIYQCTLARGHERDAEAPPAHGVEGD